DDDCNGAVDDGESVRAACDDGNQCSEDICGGALGCLHEDTTRCDGDGACTFYSCDPTLGCTDTPDDDRCDDGIDCTTEVCDPNVGCVSTPHDVDCDDGQACTTDVCDLAQGCVHTPVEGACDDGVACTVDRCEPFDGCVHDASDAACDDGNPCTADVCVPGVGCESTPLTGVPCEDGDLCTVDDVCEDGVCAAGAPRVCDDRTPCTADACDPLVGCTATYESDCDSPGPLGGYYSGYVILEGSLDLSQGERQRRGVTAIGFVCTSAVTAIVDASRAPDLQAAGTTTCAFDTDVADIVGLTGTATGDIDMTGHAIVGTAELVVPVSWSPYARVDADGIPYAIRGFETGDIGRSVFLGAPAFQALARTVYGRGTVGDVHFGLTVDLDRTPVSGDCCGNPPLGCETLTDYECAARGWSFAAAGAGRCCQGDDCSIATQSACAALGGLFMPSVSGACCYVDGGCDELTDVLCDVLGGVLAPRLTCNDDNVDGLADACGAPAGYGRTEPSACALDGGSLSCSVGGVAELPIDADFAPTGDGVSWGGRTPVSTPSPHGAVVFPEATVAVDTGGGGFGFALKSLLPDFSGVSCFPDLALDFVEDVSPEELPDWAWEYGYEARERLGYLPVADARGYLSLHVNRGISADASERVTIEREGDYFDLLLDPTDPAVILNVGGRKLERVSGNLVQSLGMGLSCSGKLTWKSAVDIWNGDTFEPVIQTGHIWRSGTFALVPIPGLPVNVFAETDLIVDVGPALALIEPILESLVDADVDRLVEVVGRGAEDVLRNLKIAGNASRIFLDMKVLDATFGRASFRYDDGAIYFTGEKLDPFGGDPTSDEFGELLDLVESLAIMRFNNTGRSWGMVSSDRFSFGMETDLEAGPFAFTGSRVTIDSRDGLDIETGSFQFDFVGFLKRLSELFTCEFPEDGGMSCAIGGVRVLDFDGGVDEGGVFVSAGLRVPVFGDLTLSATVPSDGRFTLAGELNAGFPGFGQANTKVTLGTSGYGVTSQIQILGTTINVAGNIALNGQFALHGRGSFGVFGLNLANVSFDLTNSGVDGHGSLRLFEGQSVSVDFHASSANNWSFSGDGGLKLFGYQLSRVHVSASSSSGSVALSGEVGIGSTRITLSGQVSGSSVSLSGTANLNINGYQLANAQVTLSSETGLRISGDVTVLGQRFHLFGRIEPNGDFELASAANVTLPIAGFNLDASARLKKVGWNVTLGGHATGEFAGQEFAADFSVSTTGHFSFTATASVYAEIGSHGCTDFGLFEICADFTLASVGGTFSISVSDSSFSARFSG
ncbi:MAG: hypothetical protein KC635_02630, partial [Myxococcales bacterium]|nr:hypothetical protein [Myxococcales bacterium]